MAKPKKQRVRQTRKQIKQKGLSITKHVLLGMYELTKEFGQILVNPYAVQGNKPPDYYNVWRQEQIYKAISALKRQRLIKAQLKAGQTLYTLTEAGEYEVKKQISLERIARKKATGKWYLVIFDIPENEKILRDRFRQLLKELGFKMLQASVWFHAYNVFDELESLVPDIKKHKWIKLLIVDVIVGQSEFKTIFTKNL